MRIHSNQTKEKQKRESILIGVGLFALIMVVCFLIIGCFADDQSTSTIDSNLYGDEMYLTTLDDADCLCNDLSPYTYYKRMADEPTNEWIIILEGGGVCFDSEDCTNRFENELTHFLMTARTDLTYRLGGILSMNEEVNIQYAHANRVFLPYCSSDLWSGESDSPGEGSNPSDYVFRGWNILQQVFQELFLLGMDEGTQITIAGAAASGGLGVLWNIDRLNAAIQTNAPSAIVIGFVETGWLPFIDQLRGKFSIINETKKAYPMFKSTPSDSCLSSGWTWECYFADFATKGISTPIIYFQSTFDSSVGVFYGCDSVVDEQDTWCINTVSEAIAAEIASNTLEYFALLTSCDAHVVMTRDLWGDAPLVDGTSMKESVQSAVNEVLLAENENRVIQYSQIYDCATFNCNPTCPASGWGSTEIPVSPDDTWQY